MEPQDTNTLNDLSDSMANAVERAGASVALVSARSRFPASGVAISDSLILTADHVVEHEEEIKVVLADGSELGASLAGRDTGSDLALLRLASGAAVPAEKAPQEARIGQLVLALGRPSPEGIQASLGVISAKGGPIRSGQGGLLESYLRTDATPYPGFSGGPLIDTAGRVLGINTSGLARGASLAIPAGYAWQVAETLAAHGRMQRGYLGVRTQPVALPQAQQAALGRAQEVGLLIVGVEENSPAGQGGLLLGDILTGLAGSPVGDPDELVARLVGSLVGSPTEIEILRGGQLQRLTVTVGERRAQAGEDHHHRRRR